MFRYLPVITLLLALTGVCAAPDANFAYVGQVTASPALDGDSGQALVDGKLATSLTFAVKTAGEGTVTLTFPIPRHLSAIRFYQGSPVYFTTRYALEYDAAGDGQFKPLAAGAAPLVTAWVEHKFEPVTARAVRFRSLEGVSNGARAHPCLAELEVIGKPEAGDMDKAAELGIAFATVPGVRPLTRQTPLVVGGRGPAVLAPAGGAYAEARDALLAGLTPFKAEAVSTLEAAEPGRRTVVCLGSMVNNPLLERLYWNRYTFTDALTPGTGNYLVHTVYDPYPWGGGNDVIVVGCSDPTGALPAVKAFLGALQDGKLPYLVQGGPQPLVSEAEARKIQAAKVNPTFEDFTQASTAYLKTGCEAHARRAVAALEIMARLYAPDGERRKPGADSHSVLPWNEETSSFAITCAWDAFEEHPLLGDDLRLQCTNAVLQFTRDLVRNVSDWAGINDQSTLAWNHTTFPLLGVYGGARYFGRYHKLGDMPEKLRKARQCFVAQSRSWKPQEDSDAYIPYVPDHTAQYCLSENLTEHFTSGRRRAFGDYIVAICDNRGLGSGFGDSGISSRPTEALESLPLTYWVTKDPGYKWFLDRCVGGTWPDPFDTGLKPAPPARFLGARCFMMDKQLYEYTQTTPTYNEPFAKSDVTAEQAFDKITFRDTWDPDAQYLILDGLGRGKHLHFDTNAIIEFVEGSERWLIDHDYLTRNTTEHNMLSVLRDGRGDKLVPSLAALNASADLPHCGYTDTTVKEYNGCDWRRQILWQRGEYFVVSDTVTARAAGEYDLELTWKTMDSAGEQRMVGQDFVAERGAGSAKTQACSLVDDPEASGAKALLMDQGVSRIAFGADVPAGEYSLAVVGYGIDSSSDSVWVSVNLTANVAFNLNKGRYAESTSDPANTLPTPKVNLAGQGPHLFVVTLRENPAVRLDRFVLRNAEGKEWTYEAESLPPAPRPNMDLSRYLHIRPATPLTAWITNHERQGISAPISLLHQRRGAKLEPGAQVRFTSLLYTSRPTKRRDLRPVEVAPNLLVVQGTDPGLAVLGPARATNFGVDAAGGFLSPQRFSLAGLRRLSIGDLTIEASQPAQAEFDWVTGTATLPNQPGLVIKVGQGNQSVVLEVDKAAPGSGHSTFRLPAWNPASGAGLALKTLMGTPRPAPVRGDQTETAASAPLWSAFDSDAVISAVKGADLGAGQGPCVLVARGTVLHCLDAGGQTVWQTQCGGRIRDFAWGDLRPEPGLEILVGSSDTYIYVLSAQGKLLDRYQMRGTPWARSFGDSAYAVYNVGVWDVNADGKAEMLVTMKNFDLQVLAADGTLLWKHDYATHGSMQLSFENGGSGKADTIFIGNKYGSVFGVDGKGKATYHSYTSIGDVFYAVGDLNGDGKPEVVNASSTGDMVATDFKYGGDTLWRFDNFGYPVNRVKMADLNGDGKQEVLVASGTGYLYALDGGGQVLWQDRTGFCLNDLLTTSVGGRMLVVYADESGMVRAADAAGKQIVQWRQPAPPRLLTVVGQTLVVALANGQVTAHKLP